MVCASNNSALTGHMTVWYKYDAIMNTIKNDDISKPTYISELDFAL